MICYEGTGTPVDLKIANTRKDLIEMSDPVLLSAMEQLNK
jgi:carboxyl-terminal processing protease